MNRTLLSSAFTLALFGSGLALSGVACSSGSSSSAAEATGTVSAAITAIGPDGATYALPTGTKLTLVSASNPSQTFSLAFDTTGSFASYEIPVGTYSGTLSTVSYLIRQGDAGLPTNIPATLSDAQPYQIVVTGGTATSVTFHFAIPGTGQDLSFATGSVTGNVVVSATGGSATGVGATLQFVLAPGGSSTTIGGYSTGAVQGTLTVTVAGPFVPTVDQVCAPVGNLLLAGLVNNGYEYTVLNGAGTSGFVCFSLRSAGDTGYNVLPASFAGVPTWQGNVALILPNGSTTADAYLLTGFTSVPVFDGSTLHLSQIANAASFTAASGLYWQGEGAGYTSGPASVQLLP